MGVEVEEQAHDESDKRTSTRNSWSQFWLMFVFLCPQWCVLVLDRRLADAGAPRVPPDPCDDVQDA